MSAAPRGNATRNVCFTQHGGAEELVIKSAMWKERLTEYAFTKAAIWQFELGEETNALHLQGYIEWTKPHRFAAVKRILGSDTIHLEKRRGSRRQAKEYCEKLETRLPNSVPVELGNFNLSQGHRTDIDNLHEDLRHGMDMRRVSDEHFGLFLRYPQGIRQWRYFHGEQRTWKTKVTLIIGPPGTGKSHHIRAGHHDPLECYWKAPNSNWFSGYDAHSTVVFDDFGGTWFAVSELMQIMDQYPLMVRVHHGQVGFVAKQLIITSNKSVAHWYNWSRVSSPISAIKRRVDELYIPLRPEEEVPTIDANDESGREIVELKPGVKFEKFTLSEKFPENWENLEFE